MNGEWLRIGDGEMVEGVVAVERKQCIRVLLEEKLITIKTKKYTCFSINKNMKNN